MSSDLKEPSKSITLGTFSAVGISIVLYLTAAVMFAAVMPKETLIGDYHAMRHVAVIGWLIILTRTLEDVRISEESEVTLEPDLDKVVEQSADAAVTFLPLHVKGTRLVDPLDVSFEEILSRVLISALVIAAEDIDLEVEPEKGKQGINLICMQGVKCADNKHLKRKYSLFYDFLLSVGYGLVCY
ncbi:MAG: hypothetical protein ACQEQO_07995 [Thermodesulfobacteriota bacterium]